MQGPPEFPLRIPDASQAERLRRLFQNSGFIEQGVMARLGIPGMADFKPLRLGRETAREIGVPLDALIRLFLDEEPVREDLAATLLGADALKLLESVGLALACDGQWRSPVAVYPARGLWFAADRAAKPAEGAPPSDMVYPVRDQTLAFLDTLPEIPCRRLLDLGAGTGVAALVSTRYAEHAWALDITGRAAEFARFNQALNGIENATVACGDLYEPVAGRRFDRIVSHPPYVPVSRATFVFRDGGDDGEQVLRRIVEGLPEFLEPGGRFYGYAVASDREGEPLEDRIRKWLGEKSPEFNLLLVAASLRRPDDLRSPRGAAEARHWKRVFEKLKVTCMFAGSLVIERHDSPANAFTVRMMAGPRSGWRETEWLRAWMTAAARSGSQEMLLAARPRMSAALELRSVHRVRGGRLTPEECTLAVEYPFRTECVCRPWVAAMVGACDGERTGREIFELCRAQGAAPPETTPETFARMLMSLVSGGILEMPEFPLPKG